MDKDGKLKAEEFILAMHLVDLAKSGQALPLTLPTELVPPLQRYMDSFDLFIPSLAEMLNLKCILDMDFF